MPNLRVVILAAAAVLFSPGAASAQAWPNRSVTMLVPLPAGGIADLMAREIAQALSEELGHPFVIENRPGAGGNPAATAVAKAAPDGATLLFASQAHAVFNKFMFKGLSYDSARDLVPVVVVMKSPVGIMAGMDAPVTSLQALIDYAKANPGKLTVGNAGLGSMAHLAFEMIQDKTGIKLTGVPYKGGAPMVSDLLGGHLPLATDLVANFIHLAQDKKVRILAAATSQRMRELPDVPTVQETIHAPFEAAAWFVIMAPAGTPAETVQKINAIANRYLQTAKGKDTVAKQAIEAGGGTPADAAAFVKSELEKWGPVIKAANISLN
jgi:tripartite-type tricarboxylate transporter receptor subunit TctC